MPDAAPELPGLDLLKLGRHLTVIIGYIQDFDPKHLLHDYYTIKLGHHAASMMSEEDLENAEVSDADAALAVIRHHAAEVHQAEQFAARIDHPLARQTVAALIGVARILDAAESTARVAVQLGEQDDVLIQVAEGHRQADEEYTVALRKLSNELEAEFSILNAKQPAGEPPSGPAAATASPNEGDAMRGKPEHKPVKVLRGYYVEVDEKLAELIPLLWARGIDTEQSCEEERPGLASITFPGMAEVCDFLTGAGKEYAVEVETWDEREYGGGIAGRLLVLFPVEDIPKLVEAFKAKADDE